MARERENNNTSLLADEIFIGEIVTGNLFNSNDQDVFKFYVSTVSKIDLKFTDNQSASLTGTDRDSWDILIVNIDNGAQTFNWHLDVNSESADGLNIPVYIDTPGWYYIYIEQDAISEYTDADYQFVLEQTEGYYAFAYEGNDTFSSATTLIVDNNGIQELSNHGKTVIVDGDWVYSNLYETTFSEHNDYDNYDRDYFVFNLNESGSFTFNFDVNFANDSTSDRWDVFIYDSNFDLISSKNFSSSGTLDVSTKSSGKIYVKITQDEWSRLDPSLYRFKISTDDVNTQSSNTESSPYSYVTSDNSDDNIVGTINDEAYFVSDGMDSFIGNGGYDTVEVEDGSMVIKSTDSTGLATGEVGKNYLFIRVASNGTFSENWTIIQDVDAITYGENTFNSLSEFSSTHFYEISVGESTDIIVPDSGIQRYDLSNVFQTGNQGAKFSYSFKGSNTNLNDQIELVNNILTFTSGSEGENITSTITVTASETSDNNPNAQKADYVFNLTMKDDDYIEVVKKYITSENIDNNFNVLSSYDNSTTINKNTLNFSSNDDIITLTNLGTVRGLGGDDLYFVSDLISDNAKITIVDTTGNNIIQIPKNTYIDKATFAKDSVRIQLSDNKQVTINSADDFIYNLGGNVSSGETGTNLTYQEFAYLFDVDLSNINSTEIINSDFYI